MKVLNEYPGSHHYIDEFEKCALYCPGCGHREVWEERGIGDYYLGSEFVCSHCSCNFTIQGPNSKGTEMKAEQLRSGVTREPSTPPGH